LAADAIWSREKARWKSSARACTWVFANNWILPRWGDRPLEEIKPVAVVERRDLNERRTLKIVGTCFLSLAAYIAYESAADLWSGRAPRHSVPGIILACVSLVTMPLLSNAKRKVGRALASPAMHADARQTEFCTYLSAILLVGLLLNTLFGLWWADPVAALIMVPIIAKEGIEGLQGRACRDGCAGER
jgi:hypothetical protein